MIAVYDEVAPTPRDSLAFDYARAGRRGCGDRAVELPGCLTAGKLHHALAVGNSVVLKPLKITADRFAAYRMAFEQVFRRACLTSLPALVTKRARPGRTYGRDCVAFTGSTAVGKRIAAAANSNLASERGWSWVANRRISYLPIAPDMDAAAAAAAGNVFYNQGESCNAPTRLYVQASIKRRIHEKVAAHVAGFKTGDPLDPRNHDGRDCR